jgi:phytoene dehydrogenase-like protein
VTVIEGSDDPGGGTRTSALTLDGYLHDVCSSVHPLAASSPFLSELGLGEHGLRWIEPPVAAAHPLETQPAVSLLRSVDQTITELGRGSASYRRLVERPLSSWPKTAGVLFGPIVQALRHPVAAARIGPGAVRSARGISHGLNERGRALVAGMAAHSGARLTDPFTGGVALTLLLTGHHAGWPIARGGSQQIAAALVAELERLGGTVTTGRWITDWRDLPRTRCVLFATSAWMMASICGERFPPRYREALCQFRRGPAVFKVDYALSEPIPWLDDACGRAGTVHVGGAFDDIARAEATVNDGAHPDRPFVLVTQPSLFDPTRAPTQRETAWAYCHVPNGSPIDMTARIEAQIERFAPGFSDVIVDRHVLRPADLESYNPSYAGGDIAAGAISPSQVLARPTWRIDPYRTPIGSVYLCSASTPPGPGVHGMCGCHGARSALRNTLR